MNNTEMLERISIENLASFSWVSFLNSEVDFAGDWIGLILEEGDFRDFVKNKIFYPHLPIFGFNFSYDKFIIFLRR